MSGRTRFEQTVLPHLDAGYNLARWLTHNPHDAEDVLQEACLRAFKYIGGLVGTDARSWFLAIVRNAFYDWCKRNRPEQIVHEDDSAWETIADETAIDPVQAALRSAQSQVLAEAVARLPIAFREVLILRELEELSYKEIAHITNTPIGTVMSRLARARALLQQTSSLQAIRGEPREVQDVLP